LKGLPILPLNAIRPGLCPPAASTVGEARAVSTFRWKPLKFVDLAAHIAGGRARMPGADAMPLARRPGKG